MEVERLVRREEDNYALNTMKKKIKTKPKKTINRSKLKTTPKKKTKLKIKTQSRARKVIKKETITAKLSVKAEKPIGRVTHFFNHINVVIVKFRVPVRIGADVRLKGATTDFPTVIKSMQYDHKPINVAKKGQEVGIKIKKKAREGDLVYLV